MKKLAAGSLCFGCVFAAASSHAIDLKQSKLTQVVNDVKIISAANQNQKPATVNDVFAMPDILRTGAASRAELMAQDDTLTRVGANTIFSFDPANRTIDLKQGSLLFHAPHGKGGGTIHTGSATASVLGTTLIVTTTENGGFKVIALEGKVEVRFLNGLKQKLDPGQMTFILPGANQLAPVIIFRLDELIENSLLVKGFAQTLQSLPLIENEMNTQLKLIHSGKLSDTGLYAGNSATPNQVEVLDINTISHGQQTVPPPSPVTPPPPLSGLAAAEAADASINQPSLVDASIPTPPNHVILNPSFSLPANSYFGGQVFSGFVARNIFINTLAASPTEHDGDAPFSVDLSPYAGSGNFDLVAVNNFSIAGPVVFDGLSASDDLTLIAGNQFILTPGISISAGVHNFKLSSPATLLFDNVSLFNLTKNITLDSGADISFQNNSLVDAAGSLTLNARNSISVTESQLTSDTALLTALTGFISFDGATLDASSHSIFIAPLAINLNNSTLNSDFVTLSGTASASISINNTVINAPSSIVADTARDLNVTGTTIAAGVRSPKTPETGSALNTDPASGVISLSSVDGSVNVSGTSLTAHYLSLNSGDGILLDAAGHTLYASGPGATAKFSAPNLITVRNADFSSFAVVNMAANTIVLANDTFSTSGIYNFGTHTGTVVFNGQNPGGLAFDDCFLGSAALNSPSQINFSSGPGSAAGIYSYAR
jgi:hypothetical protein